MKIFASSRIRALDSYTIKHEPISSIELMERASVAFISWFTKRYKKNHHVSIFCGPGNNGGDGLAVARLLLKNHYQVSVYYVKVIDKVSDDFQKNFQRLKGVNIVTIDSPDSIPAIHQDSVILDAIFGSGLSKPVTGLYADVIAKINESGNTIVSVDIPSGLFCDEKPTNDGAVIQATHTVSFQLPKLAFMFPQNHKAVGEWYVLDIGLDSNFIENEETAFQYVDKHIIHSIFKRREKFSHKGTFGRGLLIAGAYGKMGAAILSGRACLRSGVGLLTHHVPKCGYEIMQMSIPEAIVLCDKDEAVFSEATDVDSYDAIGIGPGLGTSEKSVNGLKLVMTKCKTPVVVDADGINILANAGLLNTVPPNTILTPHIKEFERLVGKSKDDYERLERQIACAKKHQIFIVLKGAHTAIATPEGHVYFNSTGNAGMATAGSGDVLTGIITGLLAQGHDALESSILGVYLHGLAGDQAKENLGEAALIASDIIEYMPKAYKVLRSFNG